MDDYDYLFKFVLVGDSGVGKSNLLSRYSRGDFDLQSKSTIGVEFATKTIPISGNNIKLQIWDTAGQERYRAITASYYRGATGVILVYDITHRHSFISLNNWLSEIREHTNDAEICIVGNKNDLKHLRAISTEEGQSFAKNEGLDFIEVSALTNENVQKAYEELTKNVLNRLKCTKCTHTMGTQKSYSSSLPVIDNRILLGPTSKKSCCAK